MLPKQKMATRSPFAVAYFLASMKIESQQKTYDREVDFQNRLWNALRF